MSKATNSTSTIQLLPQYKMEVLNRLLESQTVAKLLKYDSSDALFMDDLSEEDRMSLLYSRVYPYRFMPDTIEEQSTFITLGINGFRMHTIGYDVYEDYEAGEIYFYIFTHHDLMRTDSGVRQDIILGEIDGIFNGAKGFGMGRLQLRYVNELWMHNNKFGGYSVAFTITGLR